MGLISKLETMRMKQPCEGTLSVVGINMPDPSATSQNYRIDGVVSGPGIMPTAVVHHGVASVNKWPNSGDTLPITFDLTKPDRLIVNWDQLTNSGDQARAAAQALAEQMRASSSSSAAVPQPSTRPQARPPADDEADLLARGPARVIDATTDPTVLSALNALLNSTADNVVHLDAQDPGTAALRAALLHAAGQVETPTAADPIRAEPS